jgi:hypothetical protein
MGVGIQRTLSDLTTNLALRWIERPMPAPDFVAEEFEPISDVIDLRLLQTCFSLDLPFYRTPGHALTRETIVSFRNIPSFKLSTDGPSQ